jgi:hypothetical protein
MSFTAPERETVIVLNDADELADRLHRTASCHHPPEEEPRSAARQRGTVWPLSVGGVRVAEALRQLPFQAARVEPRGAGSSWGESPRRAHESRYARFRRFGSATVG